MANIENELNNIKSAVFGKDVRKSIHDGIDAINKEVEAEINAINKEVESTTGRQVDLENTFNQLVINAGNSNAEIVDARVKSDGTSYSKLGDRLNEVDSQLAYKANKEDFFINIKVFGVKGDGVTDDTILIQKAIDECCANGRSLYIPKGEYVISDILKIEYPINITGEAQHLTILRCSNGCFEISKENAIVGLSISNMTLKGKGTGIGISIGKINNVRLADSIFEHIRIEKFAIGIQSQYAWCNTYNLIRVHGCNQPFAFDSQTNCSHFNTCSFSSFSVTGTFKNCEGLVFTDCNIVNMNNNVGFTLYQSTITFNSPYFENVQNILCTIGATSEQSNSRLMLNSGIITGNIQLGNHNSVLTINESEMTPNVVKIMNAYENTTPLVYTNSVRININDLEFTPASNNNTLFSYDYRTQLKQRCISSGALVPATFHNGFSRCTMNSSTDGMLIHANIVAGEQYTLVYAIRKGENFIDAKLHQGERKLVFPLQEAGKAFELRYMYFVGSDVTPLMRLYFNGDIEIAYLKLYKGVRNSIDELPVYKERYDSAYPTEGSWSVGDRVINSLPKQGHPKSWVCVANGTPGTWVSEGTLESSE